MVELKVRMSTKGQIVIPKIFRDYYKLYPNEEITITGKNNEVVIKRQNKDVVEKLKKIAIKINEGKRKTKLNAKHINEILDEQYEEKARRSGIFIGK